MKTQSLNEAFGPVGQGPHARRINDPESLAEYLRVIFRDYVFNSPLVVLISLYFYGAGIGLPVGLVLQVWMVGWVSYLSLRFLLGVHYLRSPARSEVSLCRWNLLSIFIQALDSLFVTALVLLVYPGLQPEAQATVLAAVLVLAGSTAFSLSGRWAAIAVYAPPIYLSLAWATWQQSHAYAEGLTLFVLAMFALYMVYADNQRRSVRKGFQLAKLNAELADQLQVKNAELQEVAQGRSRLLATVSHDLRQPAHAIGLLAERILFETSSGPSRQNLNDLNQLSQSLSASLTTLMDLTRLDAGLVEPRVMAVPLEQVMGRIKAEFESLARGKGLQLWVNASAFWVRSDQVLLHGMLANLVPNAIKYTNQGQVQITSELADDQICIAVKDSGMGIHEDKLETIFKEFVRLDAFDSGSEGLGLGLSIVKRYSLLLGHRLSVQSKPGQGSCFCIYLPRAQALMASTQGEDPAHYDESRLAGLRILVVDNVDLLLSSMVNTLSAWGCQVLAARNLVEALVVSRDQTIDVLISDHHLGDLEPNGLQLIEAMRARYRDYLRAMLMTGDVSAQFESRAQEYSVDVLHKPVRPAVLRKGLLGLLEHCERESGAGQP